MGLAHADETEGLPREVEELRRRLAAVAEQLEEIRLGESGGTGGASSHGLAPSASKVYSAGQGVSLGGYGEALYARSKVGDGEPSATTDFLRAVLYTGYKFDPNWLFNSEIEFEHASTGEGGEVSVEFAYLEYQWKPTLGLRAGLLLSPMGFINEMHEPTTYWGARRPETERVVLPSTWRENGAGVLGSAGPVDFRGYLLTGMNAQGYSPAGIRGGRQAGAQALAETFAGVVRLDLPAGGIGAVPGLSLAGSAYLGQAGQDLELDTDDGTLELEVKTSIVEGHAEWNWRGLRVRALASRATIGDVPRLNQVLELDPHATVGETLTGGYAEVGFDLLSLGAGSRAALTPFVRLEQVNTQADVPTGFAPDGRNDREIVTAGLHFAPIAQVAFKLDHQVVDPAAGSTERRTHLGMGYIF
ncbi:MAG: hypothetical protein IPK72_14195 [Candidatus Eisenbacteria bacterium]|nr:hypothetical protein [Candidatus Eisenbacteria bacterium]